MQKKVLLLSQWFDPEPTSKGLVFARALVRAGYEVEVLTGFPNYPGGKVYPGYRIKCLQREIVDQVRITRLPLFPSHNQSSLGRIANYVSFAISSSIYGVLCARRFDVIYAYHPPLTVGLSASLIRLIRGTPVLYDIQDMWPDTLRATGMIRSNAAIGLLSRVCTFVYGQVDQIVVLSNGFKRLLTERGVPVDKVEVIPNWADEASLRHPLPTSVALSHDSRFTLVFAGNIGKAQALDTVLAAAAILMARSAPIRIAIVGNGVEKSALEQRSRDLALNNVEFLPSVPMQSVGSLLSQADCLLVTLKEDPLFEVTIPSKTQAYLCVGKPILMMATGDAATLIEKANAGRVVRDFLAVSLAEAAIALAELPVEARERLGENGRRFYDESLSIDSGVARFGHLFDKIMRPPKVSTCQNPGA